jgi:neutral ceramidase
MGHIVAGAASVVITPAAGYHMGAWGLRQGRSIGVHDDLYAKALVLQDENVRIAIVAMDVAGITREILENIQQRVESLTGITPAHLLVNSTHNHTTPDFINSIPEELESYALYLADLVAGVVYQAVNRLKPARVGHGWGDLSGYTVNRQYPERPVDTSIGVLRIDGHDDAPIARLINFACHNLCVGGQYLLWSADFTGVTCRRIELEDPGAVCMFISGAGGDVHPFDWWFGNTGSTHMETFEDASELGEALACESLKALSETLLESEVPLGVAASTAMLPRQRVNWTVEAARRQHAVLVEELGTYSGETWAPGTNTAIAGMLNPSVYGNGRTQLLLAQAQDGPAIRADLQAFKIGNLLISASPGELFNELGTQIKVAAGRERTWVASYSSDYIGYISTRQPHEETTVIPLEEIVDQSRYRRYYGTTTSPFAPEAGEQIVRESVELLRRVNRLPD